ncbi:MAG: hypothetical protein ASARMPREDX12_005245 [Alectoria sarmentosa]|nr:MAG: hypothetical protein ASARMPREDX12_005245 [Alectoria sarmentosa]
MLYASDLIRWLQRKRYQYEVTFSLYMLTPTEKFIFNTFLLLFISLIIVAASLYLPEHVMKMASRAWFYYAGDETAVGLSNHWSIKIEIADEEGAGGYVEDGAGESFVEGCVAVAEAGEAGAGTQSGGEGGAEGEEGVFGCMVVVDYRKR